MISPWVEKKPSQSYLLDRVVHRGFALSAFHFMDRIGTVKYSPFWITFPNLNKEFSSFHGTLGATTYVIIILGGLFHFSGPPNASHWYWKWTAFHCPSIIAVLSSAYAAPRVYGFHYNCQYIEETLAWILRFTAEAKANRPQLAYMPFGWGPRNCIGLRFALLEAKIALMEILRKYSFARAPETVVCLLYPLLECPLSIA